jgi:hypothetical protein
MRFIALLILLITPVAFAGGITDRMSLTEAIESVRQEGVEITYSSRLVEPWMRVRTTPTQQDPVENLRQVLAAYGLQLEQGQQGQWLIVKGEPQAQPLPAVTGEDRKIPSTQQEPDIRIDEVKIVASRYSLFGQSSTSDLFLSGDEINLMPHIADDVFRAFHKLPGAAATDFSAPYNLRGGAVDEVKVVLDDLELFEPYHMRTLFSPLSIVDPGIIDHVNILSGGYTAEFGNHMSGIIDISSQWTTTEPVHELGVSFINAFFRSAGAWGDRGAYQVSARRGYLDLLADSASVAGEKFTPRYSDVFAKAGYAITDTTNIDAHVLYAADSVAYSNDDEFEQGDSDSSLNYIWVTLDTEPNDQVRWNNVLSTGRVKTNDQGSSKNLPVENIDRRYERDVDVKGLQSDLYLRVSDSQYWTFGVRYRRLKADYDYEIDSVRHSVLFNTDSPLVVRRDIETSRKGDEYGVYARYRFRPTTRTDWELGLRWDKQTYTDTADDTQLSPRINFLYRASEDTDFRLGWGYYFQPQGIHELQVEDGVTNYYPATRAEQFVVGFQKQFESGVELQMDVYQKDYSDLKPRFENVLDSFDYAPESDFDRIRIDPMGAEARGAEITLRDRQAGSFDWWLSYTWSKAEDIIEGERVPRSWDQRHAATGSLTWRGQYWTLSLVGRYHSGWPQTPLLVTPVFDDDGSIIAIDGDLSQRNQENYDDYFRFDLRLSRMFDLDHGSFQFYVEIFNLLNTENQCCVSGYNLNFAPSVTVAPVFDEYVPFFPSFGFVWTFGPGAG